MAEELLIIFLEFWAITTFGPALPQLQKRKKVSGGNGQ